jgi:hypothetical protein
VLFDHHLGDVEDKSYPATILAVDLGESLKNSPNLLRGDAGSGVANGNLHFVTFRTGSLAAQADLALRRGELDGVSDQVRQDLNDPAAVANHIATPSFRFCGQGDALGSSIALEISDDFLNDFTNVMIFLVEDQPADGYPFDIQQSSMSRSISPALRLMDAAISFTSCGSAGPSNRFGRPSKYD